MAKKIVVLDQESKIRYFLDFFRIVGVVCKVLNTSGQQGEWIVEELQNQPTDILILEPYLFSDYPEVIEKIKEAFPELIIVAYTTIALDSPLYNGDEGLGELGDKFRDFIARGIISGWFDKMDSAEDAVKQILALAG